MYFRHLNKGMKSGILIAMIGMLMNLFRCELPKITGCQDIQKYSIECKGTINETTLPVIPNEPFIHRRISIKVNQRLIRNLPDDIFEGFRLRVLYLNSNNIQNISNNTFSKIRSLYELYLSSNSLTSLNFISGKNIRLFDYIKKLDLSHNQIEFLNNNTFVGLKRLKDLYLGHNLINKIKPNAFKNLDRFNSLQLKANRLNDIDNVFNEYCSVKVLNLLSNNLSIISSSVFEELSNLNTLILKDNNIKDIGSKTFENLKKLSYLYQSLNKYQK